jgi:hypothetical protein
MSSRKRKQPDDDEQKVNKPVHPSVLSTKISPNEQKNKPELDKPSSIGLTTTQSEIPEHLDPVKILLDAIYTLRCTLETRQEAFDKASILLEASKTALSAAKQELHTICAHEWIVIKGYKTTTLICKHCIADSEE